MQNKWLLLVLMAIILINSVNLNAQEKYVVTGAKLNIRTGVGTNYDVIGVFNKGDVVMVFEIIDDWALVHVSDKKGYVNKKYLRIIKPVSNIKPIKENSLSEIIRNGVIVFWVVFAWISAIRYKKRCKRCRCWNSMKKIGKEIVGEKQSSIRKTVAITDIKGYRHNNTYYIPATITYYNIYRRCKHCGFRDVLEKAKKIEN